ncbi:MAG: TonB-dependent receptor [Gammaproteobacteria bacterium]|nr:TonB-dependent receptor [Gammaproteobacteria bacterium]
MSTKPLRRASLRHASLFGFALPSLAGAVTEEIVITATRTPVSVIETLPATSSLSRERLDQLQPRDLTELLSRTPGLDLNRNGGPGATTSLFTRGTGSRHTLILVDGQRVGSATLGSTNFQFLDPAQIERIEVVRGSRSGLYGSDAIGGVVQIFTRQATERPNVWLRAGTGSHELATVTGGASGTANGLRYGINGSFQDTAGIDNTLDTTDRNGDQDGYRNWSLNGTLGYRFANGADLSLALLSSDSRNEYDNLFTATEEPFSDNVIQNLTLRGSLPLSSYLDSSLSLGLAVDDNVNFDRTTRSASGDFRTERQQLAWQNDITFAAEQLLTLGLDYYKERVLSSNVYTDALDRPVKTSDNIAGYAQFQGAWGRFDLLAGLRHDDHEQFGGHTTGNVALGFAFDDRHRLVASWAEGFKAPSFNDLYWPATPWSSGNPALDPEASENREIALRGNYSQWHWSLGYFHTDVDNLIDWAAGPDFVWRPYNVAAAEIDGGELTAGITLDGWLIDLGFTYLDPRDAATGNRLENRARVNLSLNIDRQVLDNLTVGLSLKTQDARYDDTANTVRLGGYTTITARAAWQVTKNIELTLKLDNLLDETYQLASGYRQDGFNWMFGIGWRL